MKINLLWVHKSLVKKRKKENEFTILGYINNTCFDKFCMLTFWISMLPKYHFFHNINDSIDKKKKTTNHQDHRLLLYMFITFKLCQQEIVEFTQ